MAIEAPLSAREACSILEAGAKNGVTELNFRGLQVKYGQPAGTGGFPYPESLPSPAAAPQAMTEAQHTTNAQEALAQDEVWLKEQRLRMMMIEDPEGFEKLLMSGELGDDPRQQHGAGVEPSTPSDDE